MKLFLNRHQCILFLAVLSIMFAGCKDEGDTEENAYLALTTMKIEHPVRHYYPIVQGVKKNISIKVTNTGKDALKLYKVLPSCGCTIATFPESAIAPGEDGFIELEYNSNKNIGYVGIYVTITANTKKHDHTVFFDLNVVPDALYTKDYEELYHIEQEKENSAKELTEGETNARTYTVDSIEVRKFEKNN